MKAIDAIEELKECKMQLLKREFYDLLLEIKKKGKRLAISKKWGKVKPGCEKDLDLN